MSRHRLVKNLDLADELDDYDGGEDYVVAGGDEEEMTADDKAQMQESSLKVRQVLEQEIPTITDKDIEDSLWHYYYDVEKSITYLRNQHAPRKPKKAKVGKSLPSASGRTTNAGSFRAIEDSTRMPSSCRTFSVKDFFLDSPWLNVPTHRRAIIIMEPLYPPGRLLGGNPSAPADGKMSKLAMLAAARKNKKAAREKENIGPRPSNEATSSNSDCIESIEHDSRGSNAVKLIEQPSSAVLSGLPSNGFGICDPHVADAIQDPNVDSASQLPLYDAPYDELCSTPSIFASAMLGYHGRTSDVAHRPRPALNLSMAFGTSPANADAFAGPSPDDIVTAAQRDRKSVV